MEGQERIRRDVIEEAKRKLKQNQLSSSETPSDKVIFADPRAHLNPTSPYTKTVIETALTRGIEDAETPNNQGSNRRRHREARQTNPNQSFLDMVLNNPVKSAFVLAAAFILFINSSIADTSHLNDQEREPAPTEIPTPTVYSYNNLENPDIKTSSVN